MDVYNVQGKTISMLFESILQREEMEFTKS